jgi:hypothetical protein
LGALDEAGETGAFGRRLVEANAFGLAGLFTSGAAMTRGGIFGCRF